MPTNPPRQPSSAAGPANENQPHAIILTRRWEYRDQEFDFGRKNPVPDQFKRNGLFQLFDKDEGFLLASDTKNQWGLGEFLREGVRIKVMVPMNRIRVGAPMRSLAAKLSEGATIAPIPAGSIDVAAGTCLEKYIRSLWVGMRRHASTLRQTGMRSANVDAAFSNDLFIRNVNAILNGFTPPARSLLEDGHFRASDLVGLREVQTDWPRKDLWTVYLRVYTHQDDAHANVEDFAIYAGQSTDVQARMRTHRQGMADNLRSFHYRLARRSPPSHQHMIPIMLLDPAVIGANAKVVLDMAEQTATSMFNAYHSLIKSDRSPSTFAVSKSHYTLVTSAHDAARQVSGWPEVHGRGCNVRSPLYGAANEASPIYCYRSRATDPDSKPFTTYRCAVKFHSTGSGAGEYFLYWRRTDGTREVLRLPLDTEALAANNLEVPLQGYLVFEIMQNGQDHPRPWMRVPSVGPFQEFGQANSIGVRCEVFRADQGKWISIPMIMGTIALINSAWRDAIRAPSFEKGREALLRPWRRAMTLIQMLEGITYTGQLNGFEKRASIANRPILELETDHINQRARWVLRREQSRPVPARATWEHNVDLMMREFNNEHTLITPNGPPAITEPFWQPTPLDQRLVRGKKATFCDLCKYTYTQKNGIPCERDPNRTDVWVCKLCSLMGKPCTFTPSSIAARLWGSEKPWVETSVGEHGFSQNPTGPYKTMTYSTTKIICSEVPEPFGGVLGLQMEDAEEEETELAQGEQTGSPE